MHMADALLSPAVGATMWAVSAGTIACCSRKVRREMDDSRIPLMGVLGAFIFAAQMVNFSIPVTGSSGHLGGGLILAILLGPYAAFLVIASVLVVQALFFADGGLLALGCNIFNLGFFPAFIAYPFIYTKIIGRVPSAARVSAASLTAAVAGLQLGAFAVVLETVCSGISSLPFATFAAIMQPVHLAIGIVEGLVTAAVVLFVHKARPDIMHSPLEAGPAGSRPLRNVALAFLAAAMVTGGIVSRFASTNPDGLEWAIAKVTGRERLKAPEQVLQAALNALPDHSFEKPAQAGGGAVQPGAVRPAQTPGGPGDPLGSSLAGTVGGSLTLGMVFLIGFLLKRRK
jgi:cobalt/nickel transport system permease protein